MLITNILFKGSEKNLLNYILTHKNYKNILYELYIGLQDKLCYFSIKEFLTKEIVELKKKYLKIPLTFKTVNMYDNHTIYYYNMKMDDNYKNLLLNNANFLAISGYIWNNKNYKPFEAIKRLK